MFCSRFRDFLGSENIIATSYGCAGSYKDTSSRAGKDAYDKQNGQDIAVTIIVLDYTLLISRLIRKARRCGAITPCEAEYLLSTAWESFPGESTRALVSSKGAPDFTYAALYFSTLVWQMGDACERDDEARAGYELAQFVLSQESIGPDSYWAAKLLRELYEAHSESGPLSDDGVTRWFASG